MIDDDALTRIAQQVAEVPGVRDTHLPALRATASRLHGTPSAERDGRAFDADADPPP